MDLLRIYFDGHYNLVISVASWLLITLAVLTVIAFLIGRFSRRFVSAFEINQAEFGIGNQKITIRPSTEDRQVAYKLWVEMATRKIGLPVDETHDVITEIYSSWYDFFGVARELLKALPISALRRSSDSKTLVKITVELLNEQLRPHLTTWQAKFRKWYDAQCRLPECGDLTPQEVQRRYPEYQALMAHMRQTNERLIRYREMLRDLAIG